VAASSEQAVEPVLTVAVTRAGSRWARLDAKASAALLVGELIFLLAVWQVGVGVFELIPPIFFPPPTAILGGFGQIFESGELARHLTASMSAWIVGYGLAIVVGVVAGIGLGAWLPFNRLAGPVLWSLYATPWLAWRPLSVAWFGFGIAPIIFLVFIAAIFPVMLNTAAGVSATEPSLISAGRVFGGSRISIYRKIVLPSAVPFVFAGMRQSAVMATIALLVGELTGAAYGLGALIANKTALYQTDEAFAAIILAVAWTLILTTFLDVLRRRVAPWQTDVTTT
jgi:ABC-type nitrate/sulfonate/bicarbonate transport system permease component